MCSGCSGDYAGEFDDTGEPAADSCEVNREKWDRAEPDQQRSQRNSEKTRAFESNGSSRREWPLATAPWLSDQRCSDACEILVSGRRIIEIRMIEVNDGEVDELARLASTQAMLRQHSAEASAKYYQTPRARGENSSDRAQLSFFQAFSRAFSGGMAGIMGVNFNRWLRRAREALGTRRAKKFCMSSRDLGGGDGIARP